MSNSLLAAVINFAQQPTLNVRFQQLSIKRNLKSWRLKITTWKDARMSPTNYIKTEQLAKTRQPFIIILFYVNVITTWKHWTADKADVQWTDKLEQLSYLTQS